MNGLMVGLESLGYLKLICKNSLKVYEQSKRSIIKTF